MLKTFKMPEQESFVIWILPDKHNVALSGERLCFLISLGSPTVEQNGFAREGIAAAFQVGYSLNCPFHKCVWVTRARLQFFDVNMQMYTRTLIDKPVQEGAVANLAFSFTTEIDRRALSSGSPAPHPICGIAP